MIVEMGNCTYDEWKTVFDADSYTDAQFIANIIVGKVDEHTEIVGADVFASEKMEAMMSVRNFGKFSLKLDVNHTVCLVQSV